MDKLPAGLMEEAEINSRSPLVLSPVHCPSHAVISSWCYLHSCSSFGEAHRSDFVRLSEAPARCSDLF